MNKNKIKELIGSAITSMYISRDVGLRDSEREAHIIASENTLHKAIAELDKSDWISVKDELPEYGEEVLVCNKNFNKYLIAIRHHMGIDRQLDKNGFIKGFGITHWKPIEKLEE